MGGSLIAALVLNVTASAGLASGSATVPIGLDEAILHLELWGFASTMIFAIGQHAWRNLLLLPPTRQSLVSPSLVLWATGVFGGAISWLAGTNGKELGVVAASAQIGGLVLYAHALGLLEPAARTSSLPQLTNPARMWVRTAFLFLLASGSLELLGALGRLLPDLPTIVAGVSGPRHLLAQGFLLPIMVFMAARILPGYSALMVTRPRTLATLMWSFFVSALLRGGSESIGGYGDGWNLAVASGGTLAVGAFLIFAVGLWRATPPTVQHGRALPVLD
jgi:hypothetical protein